MSFMSKTTIMSKTKSQGTDLAELETKLDEDEDENEYKYDLSD